ncbi:MAG: rhodanese-like domain-containing protein [Candidatus Kapaibacterium sp.]
MFYLFLIVCVLTTSSSAVGLSAQKSAQQSAQVGTQKSVPATQPERRMKLDTIKVEGFRPKDVKTIMEHDGADPVLLDVRTPEEFARGHLKGAINIPLMELERRLASLRKYQKRTIITMCEKGVKGMQACGILVANRIGWTFYMKTGIDGWVKEGLPLEH